MSETPAQPQETQMQTQGHEKSEAEVADQIRRIALRLGGRATDRYVHKADTPGNALEAGYHATWQDGTTDLQSRIVNNRVDRDGRRTTTSAVVEGDNLQVRKEVDEHAVQIYATKAGEVDGMVGPTRTEGIPKLSLKESKQAAAKILSQTRGEIARRENEMKKPAYKRSMDNIIAA